MRKQKRGGLQNQYTVSNAICAVRKRSPARDIIDSSWSDETKSATLLKVVETIAGKFDITVQHLPRDVDYTETIPALEWNCESPWTQLLNAADNQGYVLTSNEAGNLYLTKSGRNADYWHFVIAEGMNDGRQRMQFETWSDATALPSFSIEKLER